MRAPRVHVRLGVRDQAVGSQLEAAAAAVAVWLCGTMLCWRWWLRELGGGHASFIKPRSNFIKTLGQQSSLYRPHVSAQVNQGPANSARRHIRIGPNARQLAQLSDGIARPMTPAENKCTSVTAASPHSTLTSAPASISARTALVCPPTAATKSGVVLSCGARLYYGQLLPCKYAY